MNELLQKQLQPDCLEAKTLKGCYCNDSVGNITADLWFNFVDSPVSSSKFSASFLPIFLLLICLASLVPMPFPLLKVFFLSFFWFQQVGNSFLTINLRKEVHICVLLGLSPFLLCGRRVFLSTAQTDCVH